LDDVYDAAFRRFDDCGFGLEDGDDFADQLM